MKDSNLRPRDYARYGSANIENIKKSPSFFEFHDVRYVPPTPEEIKLVIDYVGLSSAELGKELGISDGRTVRRWKSGQTPMPYAAWRLLLAKAGLIKIKKLVKPANVKTEPATPDIDHLEKYDGSMVKILELADYIAGVSGDRSFLGNLIDEMIKKYGTKTTEDILDLWVTNKSEQDDSVDKTVKKKA